MVNDTVKWIEWDCFPQAEVCIKRAEASGEWDQYLYSCLLLYDKICWPELFYSARKTENADSCETDYFGRVFHTTSYNLSIIKLPALGGLRLVNVNWHSQYINFLNVSVVDTNVHTNEKLIYGKNLICQDILLQSMEHSTPKIHPSVYLAYRVQRSKSLSSSGDFILSIFYCNMDLIKKKKTHWIY